MVALPTWDLFITLCFIIGLGYGLILGRQRIIVVLVACYVAYAVALVVGETIYSILSGSTLLSDTIWIKSNISEFGAKALIFGIVAVLLTLKGEISALPGKFAGGGKSAIVVVLYGFLTSGLVVSSIISFLSKTSQQALFYQSSLAELVMKFHNWWLILPIVLMVSLGIFAGTSNE